MIATPYWITNQLAIVPRPRGGDWLEDEMDALREAGIDVVVSMLQENEASELGLQSEGEAARRSGRPLEAIRMVAVTKKTSPGPIRSLIGCGARELGENYPQELWTKFDALADLQDSVHWHLIGHLQTNKVKKTLPLVKMIHSVDSLKLLRVLNETAQALVTPPSVCLQVNTSDEEAVRSVVCAMSETSVYFVLPYCRSSD